MKWASLDAGVQSALTFVLLAFIPYVLALLGLIAGRMRFATAIARGEALVALLLCALAIVVPLFIFMIPFVVIPVFLNIQLFRWAGRAIGEDEEMSTWSILPAAWLLTIVLGHAIL